jgi:hypothetical protein
MVGEVFAGLSAFKSMFDMAKGLKDINDAAIRNGAVIELQSQILAAQEEQATLIQKVRDLEVEVARFDEWNVEKQRYELADVGNGVMAYRIKEDAQGAEPPHSICPDCYQRREKSLLQIVIRVPGRANVLTCQTCGWAGYISGMWQQEHGGRSIGHRR